MTIDDRVKALAKERSSKALEVVEDISWTEEQLREEGIEYCSKHPEISLIWTMLEVELEGKPTKPVSFGLCEKCERRGR